MLLLYSNHIPVFIVQDLPSICIYIAMTHAQFYRCNETLVNTLSIKGKIILCFSTQSILSVETLVGVANSVILNGGRGFIYTQYSTDILEICSAVVSTIPCVAINREISYQIAQYLRYSLIHSFCTNSNSKMSFQLLPHAWTLLLWSQIFFF